MPSDTAMVLVEVASERAKQDARWGMQDSPNGTGGGNSKAHADLARNACDEVHSRGACTYAHILREEFAEAMAEESDQKLRAELIQVAAVCVKWIEAIDRRYP